MAQVDSPTNKGYAKAAGLMAALSLWIALDEGDMGSNDATTNAAIDECVVSGLARAAATVTNITTTVANDTMQATKTFTSGGDATLTGFLEMSAAADGDCYQWCAFNASQVLESGDQIVCTAKTQYLLGS